MNKGGRIDNASLSWVEHSPRSRAFDDVYFSGDGADEAKFVFLRGSELPERFENAKRFVIGELGFGTGLNFLTTWDAWRQSAKAENATLDFLSFEAFPLSRSDMQHAHEAWPHLNALAEMLRAKLPPAVAGFHRLDLEAGVTLTLYYGNALEGLKSCEGIIDAWYFDGFAPSKNPDMWSPEVFAEAARLSKSGSTYATFTVAGAVRRALQAAGFSTEKRAGFGQKKEMLGGRLAQGNDTPIRRPWFDSQKKFHLDAGARIAVIGAGVAGASLAHFLARLGCRIVVYDSQGPASGASGNPAGLIMPRLDAGDTPAARFHKHAYLHTLGLIENLTKQNAPILFNQCGVLLHATDDKEHARQEKLVAENALPPDWMESRKDGLFFSQAGVLHPKAFVQALLNDTPVKCEKVLRVVELSDRWRVETDHGALEEFDAVFIANGLEAMRFSQVRSIPLAGSAGQIDWFPKVPPPECAHAFGPYAAPAPEDGVVIGATYAPIAIGLEPRFTQEATQSNIDAIRRTMPELATLLKANESKPRASVRCTTPDRLPVAGPVPDWGFYAGAYDGLRYGRKEEYKKGKMLDGLFVMTGFGSRGLVTAPYAAAIIAAELAGAPSPADVETIEALHPARFFIRDMKRSKKSR